MLVSGRALVHHAQSPGYPALKTLKSQTRCNKNLDSITCLSRWPKSKTLTTPNIGKDVEQQEILFIVHEFQSGMGLPSHFGLGREVSGFLQNYTFSSHQMLIIF